MTNVQNDPPHISRTPAGAPSTGELGDAIGTLRMLVDQAPVAVIAYDLEGHVTEWNPAAERVLGWTREETIGRTPPHVSETNRLEFDSNQYRTIAQGGMAGEVVGFVSMLKDVTADHQARTEIADLEAKLRHA